MKRVLILGAGLVAKPIVRYLLEHDDFEVTVATRTVSKAERIIAGHPRGKAVQWTVDNTEGLKAMVGNNDLVVSLLPYAYHVMVARECIAQKKHLVTTSYVKPEMRALDADARKAGVLLLNEIGLDPGIDHMSAMRTIHDIKNRGGRIVSFNSYCGALPAPEAADNPWKYKFSWSPRGVVLAAKNSARYLKDGKEISIPAEELFKNYFTTQVEGIGELEVYPNRDSVSYIETYSVHGIETIFRGTLRYPGWCETWAAVGKLGLLSEEEISLGGMSYRDFVAKLMGIEGDPEKALPQFLGVPEDSHVIEKFRWLGLLSDERVPFEKSTPLDVFADLLEKKLQYKEGERDMVILKDVVVGEFPNGKREKITSTLIDFGRIGNETAVARTVSLPAAAAVRFILEGKINLSGVYIPVVPEIYKPVLEELERLGMKMTETVEEL